MKLNNSTAIHIQYKDYCHTKYIQLEKLPHILNHKYGDNIRLSNYV